MAMRTALAFGFTALLRCLAVATVWMAVALVGEGRAQTPKALEAPQGAAAAGGTTLLKLFPELAGLPDASTFHVVDTWMGLSPDSPVVKDYPLMLKNNEFVGQAVFSEGGKQKDEKQNVAIPLEVVQKLWLVVLGVAIEEMEYKPRIDHTDDYPALGFEAQVNDKLLRVWTQSQPKEVNSHWIRTPWAIGYSDRTFVVSTPELDFAIDSLYDYLGKR